jgi:hypothetical protein
VSSAGVFSLLASVHLGVRLLSKYAQEHWLLTTIALPGKGINYKQILPVVTCMSQTLATSTVGDTATERRRG